MISRKSWVIEKFLNFHIVEIARWQLFLGKEPKNFPFCDFSIAKTRRRRPLLSTLPSFFHFSTLSKRKLQLRRLKERDILRTFWTTVSNFHFYRKTTTSTNSKMQIFAPFWHLFIDLFEKDACIVSVYIIVDRLSFVTRYRKKTTPLYVLFFAKGAYVTEIEMNKSHHIKEEKIVKNPFTSAAMHTRPHW